MYFAALKERNQTIEYLKFIESVTSIGRKIIEQTQHFDVALFLLRTFHSALSGLNPTRCNI